MSQQHFGEHLTIDGYGGDPVLLDSQKIVRAALLQLTTSLYMHPISDAQVVAAPDNQKKDPGGWSGVILIAESHISIHTFPHRRFVSADVYTCQNGLDVAFVTSFLKTTFDLKDIEVNHIRRGLKYPEKNCV